MADQTIFDFGGGNLATCQALKRGDAAVRNAARHDQLEEVEIGVQVVGEAVAGHPPLDADADGADFLRANPRAGQTLDASGLDLVVARHADHGVFQIANVAVHVAAVGFQTDDRVSNNLARAVIRHITAAAGFVQLDAQLSQSRRSGYDVLPAFSSLHAERQHVRMLQQQQHVLGFARHPPGHKLPLQRRRRPIAQPTINGQSRSRTPRLRSLAPDFRPRFRSSSRASSSFTT